MTKGEYARYQKYLKWKEEQEQEDGEDGIHVWVGNEYVVSTDEEIKKINKRLIKVERQLQSVREIVYCPACIYRKTCIHTSSGIERDGFCKWGVREREDG